METCGGAEEVLRLHCPLLASPTNVLQGLNPQPEAAASDGVNDLERTGAGLQQAQTKQDGVHFPVQIEGQKQSHTAANNSERSSEGLITRPEEGVQAAGVQTHHNVSAQVTGAESEPIELAADGEGLQSVVLVPEATCVLRVPGTIDTDEVCTSQCTQQHRSPQPVFTAYE